MISDLSCQTYQYFDNDKNHDKHFLTEFAVPQILYLKIPNYDNN